MILDFTIKRNKKDKDDIEKIVKYLQKIQVLLNSIFYFYVTLFL